jgi:hypothetical protein
MVTEPSAAAIEAHADAAARLLGLDLSPESREAVIANLRVLTRLARVFEGEPLDPHADPLPVFRL